MARFQNGHPSSTGPGSCFVTLVLTQNQMGEVAPAAFMASDQAMALGRCDVLSHSSDPEWCVALLHSLFIVVFTMSSWMQYQCGVWWRLCR